MAENKELKVSISSNLDATGFNQAQSKIKDLSAHSDKLSASFKTFAGIAASLGAVTLFKEQITQTLEFADSLNKLSQKTGITADGLYSLSAAAKLSDVDFQEMSKSLGKFSKAIGETSMGTGDAKKAFDTLGVSVKNNDGTLKNSFDLLGELADKFEVMPDGASKATLAMQLFGKSGASMIPMLNGGSEALKEYSGIMSNDVAKSAERFNDSLTKVGLALNGSLYTALGNYTSSLDSLSKTFEDFSKNGTFLEANAKSLAGAYDIASSSFNTAKEILNSANVVFKTSSNLLHGIAESITSIGKSGEDAEPKLNFFQFLAVDVQVLGLAVKIVSNTVNAAINDFMNLGNRVDVIIAKSKNFVGAGSKENDVKIAQLESWIAQRNMQNAHMALEEAELAVQIEKYKKRSDYENNLKYTKKYLDEAKANIYDLKQLAGEIDYKRKTDFGLTNSDEYEKALIKINDAINKNSLTAYEYGVSLIEKEVAEYQKAGISKAKIDEYVFNAKMELGIKQLEEEIKQNEQREKEVKAQYEKEQDAMLGYYKAVGMESDAFYLEEVMKLQKLADAGILSNSQMLEIWAKDNEKFLDEQFKKNHEWLYDLFDNINKALDESFFDTMTGKFKSFGSWLNDFFGSIGDSILRGLSRTLAGNITSSLQTSIVSAMQGGNYARGVATLAGGASVANAGESDSILGNLSMLSSLKTAYDVLSGGISGTLLNGFNSVAGLTGVGSIAEFGAGFANPFAYAGMQGLPSAMTYGSLASAGLLGGGIGYGVGSLGDKLFGANTYAGVGGALGGATGGLLASIGIVGGPVGILVGSLLGSALGGIFGKTTTTDKGLNFGSTTGAGQGFDDIQSYISYKKKSWFSSSSWSDYSDLTSTERKKIEGIFNTYDYLLIQLGETDRILLEAGKYSGDSFQDALAKKFIEAFTEVSQSTDDTIYKAWKDYADSIDKTVIEALTESVNTYIASMRDFETWALNRSGNGLEALAKQSQWLTDDFNNLAQMVGAVGVTVENYTAKYKEAVENSFDPSTITQWQQLGTALRSATDAADAYKNAVISSLTNEMNAWVTALGSVQGAIDALSPTFKTMEELANSSITLENYSSLLSQLESARQNEIAKLTASANERIEQLNNEKSMFESLADFIDELRNKIIDYSATTSSYFYSDLAKAKEIFSSGGIVDTAKLTSSASSYLDKVKNESTSKLEYFREIAKVQEGLGSLGSMVTGGSLEGIYNAITKEEATLAEKLDTINQTALAILNSWKGTATGNIASLASQINTVKKVDPVITQAYENILGRAPEEAGGEYWQSLLDTGKTTASAITPIIAEAAIQELYATVLGREADASGLAHWTNVVQSGTINPYQLDEIFKEAAKAELAINGSHASGLDYVPFDGYIAELHKGERVQTASEVTKDAIITELKNEIKDLKDIFIKNTAEMTRMSKAIQRVMPDGDALQVRTAV